MKNWGPALWGAAFGVVFTLLAVGVVWLTSSPPRGEPITLSPPPTKPPVYVHVDGAVNVPGVHALPPGSRVRDAVQAAGGLQPEAQDMGLNLAAFVQDGDLVYIPFATEPVQDSAPGAAISPYPTLSTQGLININTADQEQLETLPGIGPVTAGKIITYREANGPFSDIQAIQNVSGIGPVTFENIKELITVQDQPW
jgi:competence protein ComEA